jgi:dihydroxy-acid dehydratase
MSVLPRSIAKLRAFENAMTLDIAMGGSTNTVLHILAAAHEGGIDFTMKDIDRLSRRVPVLCKVAPAKSDVHMEDVHRAGGIMAILGELDRGGLINRDLPTVHARTWARRSTAGTSPAPIRLRARILPRRTRRRAHPGRLQPVQPLGRARPRPQDGRHPRRGARLLQGRRPRRALRQLALDGCIVKTAGVDESILKFTGPAKVFESQDAR